MDTFEALLPYIVELKKTEELRKGWWVSNNWSILRRHHTVKTVQLPVVEWSPRSFLNPLQSFLILYRDFHAVKRIWEEGGKGTERNHYRTFNRRWIGNSFSNTDTGYQLQFQVQNYQKELVLHPECSWTVGTHTCETVHVLKVWRVSEEQLGRFLGERTEGDPL